MTTHECDMDCWEQGCDWHEVCRAGRCIPAAVVAAEYRQQAESADANGASILRGMADGLERQTVR